MLENLKRYNVILASNSPRRKELLTRLGVSFKVRTLLGIDERYPSSLRAEEIAECVSRKKAAGYRSYMANNELLICADTIIVLGNEILGKPRDVEEASATLRKLSSRTHQVITGVTVQTDLRIESFTAMSKVTFGEITDEEIDYYISNYLPLDKAGSYGIQDWIGMISVEHLEGSYFNVVGLPTHKLYQLLKTF